METQFNGTDIKIRVERLVGRQGRGKQPALGEPVLQLQVVALPEELAFLFLVRALREAPMNSAAIFELDLALFDL